MSWRSSSDKGAELVNILGDGPLQDIIFDKFISQEFESGTFASSYHLFHISPLEDPARYFFYPFIFVFMGDK